jgi:probable selenium-dependent hydroxylase accessory protein YqeC
VIPVLSAKVLGQPLSDRIAHRLDRFMAITGAQLNKPITPTHVARLLVDEYGALRLWSARATSIAWF